MPRVVLFMFCLAYLIPGFVGRDAWKGADVAALGWMSTLAEGTSQWLHPTLVGMSPENPAVLPYWLGAWAIAWCPGWMDADFAARIPFALLLGLVMLTTWHGTYCLARSPNAQPVAFAFGGEPQPKEYARAIADGGLLALIACLGLAQLAHEATPALAQLGFSGWLLYALAALPWRAGRAIVHVWVAMLGLSLRGAPALAQLLALGGVAALLLDPTDGVESLPAQRWRSAAWVLAGSFVAALGAWKLDLWRWKIEPPQSMVPGWQGYIELLTWFTWPAWPLAVWTVWRWRRQLFHRQPSRHLLVPLWFVVVTLVATLLGNSSDRILLLGLPALAALAAFALPTLKRQVASLIDWFTLLFFSGCGVIIWVVWIAMETGFPSQPSANVARLAPGFVASFSFGAFIVAALATLGWTWLVKWRVGRHRAAIWKSLVLPAGGASLCWLLLMTLWMPLLNYAQSYKSLVQHTLEQLSPAGCVESVNLGPGKLAAFQFYGKVALRQAGSTPQCPWLIAEPGDDLSPPPGVDLSHWAVLAAVLHPTDGNESLLLFKRR